MITLHVEESGKNRVAIRGIDWITRRCLVEVPEILAQAKEGPARDRLFQKVHATDDKQNEEWRTLVTPDLEHLFASAKETFARDIRPLNKTTKSQEEFRDLTIPRSHCDAWLSAVNQARLILGAQYNVTEQDMDEREFEDPTNPKVQALLRIHVLGYVVQLLVEFVSGEPTA